VFAEGGAHGCALETARKNRFHAVSLVEAHIARLKAGKGGDVNDH